jgi:hypothetical protein
MWPAPTATGCGAWSPSPPRPGPCGRWSGPATTWSTSVGRWPPAAGHPGGLPAGRRGDLRRRRLRDLPGVPGALPHPASAARLTQARLASFLTKAGYSGRRPAGELGARLTAAPAGVLGAEAEAGADAVRAMVRVLRALLWSIKDLDRSVIAHLGEHPDAEVFTSLPRSGQINAAQMLAEWGDCRQAYPQADSVAMLGGLCPVTHASGKHRDVSFRWACNKRLRQAMTCFANNSRRTSPWAAEVYRQAIARGCDHPHAVRILARAWTRVIWRCWQDRAPYDPALHRAARRLKAA